MEKLIICLSGLDTGEFLELVLSHLQPNQSTVFFLYVKDTRPGEELGYIPRPHLFRSGNSGARNQKMDQADQEIARQVFEEAREKFLQKGWGENKLNETLRQGRPEREIVQFSEELKADLLVIGARYKGGPLVAAGPASIGPVARYVIDHSRCDLLVIKG